MIHASIARPLARFLTGAAGVVLTLPGSVAGAPVQAALIHPAVSDYAFINAGTTPPTEAQCEAVGRTCFTPQAIQSAYNVAPLHAAGLTGRGVTIAIVDSYGSDTMAHDLHVFNQAFGLAPMCGEEGVTCASGMPTFSELSLQGTPATVAQPGNGTHLEDKSAWALEVALDVETAHAIAPGANILLVHTATAETLGVQGFPQMMAAEDYVVKHGLAQVISQSFASAEDAFGSFQSLDNLRYAFKDAAAMGVTVLGSSGDDGTANSTKQALVGQGPNTTVPYPSVVWPASDPLVTGIGGTYLCTDPLATATQPRTTYSKPGIGAKCASNSPFNPGGIYQEVAWTFSGGGYSHVFPKPSWQNTLPAGSSFSGTTRGVPDVALQASSATGALIYLSLPPDGNGSNIRCGSAPCSSGWYDIGGTSLSCPQWAGLVAIADQINGGLGLGLINPALYRIGADPGRYANDFFDIATGNSNQADASIPGYPSTTGWDAVTGLGTPNAANLVPDLVAAAHGG
jgi:subtilase family serine protease